MFVFYFYIVTYLIVLKCLLVLGCWFIQLYYCVILLYYSVAFYQASLLRHAPDFKVNFKFPMSFNLSEKKIFSYRLVPSSTTRLSEMHQ